LRQAYDYWQDQPGSPRRGCTRSDCTTHHETWNTPQPHTSHTHARHSTPGRRNHKRTSRSSRDDRAILAGGAQYAQGVQATAFKQHARTDPARLESPTRAAHTLAPRKDKRQARRAGCQLGAAVTPAQNAGEKPRRAAHRATTQREITNAQPRKRIASAATTPQHKSNPQKRRLDHRGS